MESCDCHKKPGCEPVSSKFFHGKCLASVSKSLFDVCDAFVQLASFEAAKGFTKSQIANYVKGDVVEPVSHIKGCLGGLRGALFAGSRGLWTTLPQSLHHQVDVTLDNGLLCAQTLLAEAMAQLPTEEGVVVSRLGQHAGEKASGPVESHVLAKLLAFGHSAIVVAVDVLPGLRRGVHEVIRCDTNDRPILLGEDEQVARPLSAENANDARKSRGAVEKRAWVVPEWVEEDVVDGGQCNVSDQLPVEL